jgi:hypothetical protein
MAPRLAQLAARNTSWILRLKGVQLALTLKQEMMRSLEPDAQPFDAPDPLQRAGDL